MNQTLRTENKDLTTKLEQAMTDIKDLKRDLEIMKSLSRKQDEEMGIYDLDLVDSIRDSHENYTIKTEQD